MEGSLRREFHLLIPSMPMKPALRSALGWIALLAFAVALRAAPPEPVKGGVTFVVVPDSQKYVWNRPELYTLQTGWIAANVGKYNLVRLLHVGDVTQHNNRGEWEAARRAHRVYEGLIPAIYASGNHDIGLNGKSTDRDSLFSEMIPISAYRAQGGFGGVYDREPARSENSYHVFEAAGRKWLVLALEFGPRDDVLRWANEVVDRHPKHSAVLVTHAYLRADGARFDRRVGTPGQKRPNKGFDHYLQLSKAATGFNDGGDMWDKLVSRHANFVLVLSGHVCTSAHLVSTGIKGNTVHQVLVDYQDAEQGGNGWLRLLQIFPDGRTVRVRDYTPLLDQTSTDPGCTFDFQLDPPMQ